MPTSNAPVAWPPAFRTVFVTATVKPGAVAGGDAVALATVRSGPTRSGSALAPTLFAVVISAIARSSFAWTSTKYAPGWVPTGMFTLVAVIGPLVVPAPT